MKIINRGRRQWRNKIPVQRASCVVGRMGNEFPCTGGCFPRTYICKGHICKGLEDIGNQKEIDSTRIDKRVDMKCIFQSMWKPLKKQETIQKVQHRTNSKFACLKVETSIFFLSLRITNKYSLCGACGQLIRNFRHIVHKAHIQKHEGEDEIIFLQDATQIVGINLEAQRKVVD